MRVAFNIVFANNSTDVRSDDEDNAEEEGEGEKAKKRAKGKKGVNGDGGPSHVQLNGLNSTSEEKSFAEVVQQGQEKKKDL